MSEWQPITTVPKDVEFIIAAWPIGNGYDVGELYRDGDYWYCGVTNDAVVTATHWMPLPDPPETP